MSQKENNCSHPSVLSLKAADGGRPIDVSIDEGGPELDSLVLTDGYETVLVLASEGAKLAEWIRAQPICNPAPLKNPPAVPPQQPTPTPPDSSGGDGTSTRWGPDPDVPLTDEERKVLTQTAWYRPGWGWTPDEQHMLMCRWRATLRQAEGEVQAWEKFREQTRAAIAGIQQQPALKAVMRACRESPGWCFCGAHVSTTDKGEGSNGE